MSTLLSLRPYSLHQAEPRLFRLPRPVSFSPLSNHRCTQTCGSIHHPFPPLRWLRQAGRVLICQLQLLLRIRPSCSQIWTFSAKRLNLCIINHKRCYSNNDVDIGVDLEDVQRREQLSIKGKKLITRNFTVGDIVVPQELHNGLCICVRV